MFYIDNLRIIIKKMNVRLKILNIIIREYFLFIKVKSEKETNSVFTDVIKQDKKDIRIKSIIQIIKKFHIALKKISKYNRINPYQPH